LRCAAPLPTLRPPPLRRAEAPLARSKSASNRRRSRVLVVDDEELYRSALKRILARVGHEVRTARDAAEALQHVGAERFDLALCDVHMPGLNGIELIRQIRDLEPDLPCIVVTGHGTPQNSIEALRAGAFWYLHKPFEQEDLELVRGLVEQAIEHGRLKSDNKALQAELRHRYGFDHIVGKSEPLQRVLAMVEKIADTESTVLVTGESGTGKELIARALHYNSRRSERPLVTVNCGAIPEQLLESELFGHVRGAFTSADAAREGRFTAAQHGSIFLDEIGDMSPNLQVKLLRVLQEKTFEPVGSSETQHADVRVIAATNQDLPRLIEEKRFREDLYYRLNVLPLEVPPLRERRDDIPLLVRYFMQRANRERREPVESVSEEALEALCRHPWPGNVRELENTLQRMVLLDGDGKLGVDDLPPQVAQPPPVTVPTAPRLPDAGLSFRDAVEDLEADLILQALERTHWNKNRAAQLLGLNRTTLEGKIRKKGLVPPPGR